MIALLLAACTGEPADTGTLPESVEVPAGSFLMGCEPDRDATCDPDEQPAHDVELSGFRIDTLEVSVGQFAACVDDGVCTTPATPDTSDEQPGLPRTHVSVDQAARYCEWAGKRLPTEAEWEKAARGTDGRLYPWGDEAPDCATAALPGCGDRVAPVGTHPGDASPYGALDMAGNAWEWVSDYYDDDYYAASPPGNPEGPDPTGLRVVRGATHLAEAGATQVTSREPAISGASCPTCGFRCVEEL